MGTGNVALWRELNVGHDKKCHFAHPCDVSLKIFVWADVPHHHIKLVRNHLIDHGMYMDDYLINKDYFEALLNLSSTELTIAYKLKQDHINISRSARQRVRPAVHLLPYTVAKAITYAGEHGLTPKSSRWSEASAVVQLFNDWFDIMNSRSKFIINCPVRNGFGTDIEKQKVLLHKMTEVITIIRIVSHISASDTNILSLNSFEEPAYLEDESLNEDLLSLMDQFEIKEKIHMEAFKYITGYIAYKFKNKYERGIPTTKIDVHSVPDWLQTISRGSLLYPNEELWEVAKTMDEEFYKLHGTSLPKNKSIFHDLAQQTISKLKNNSVAFEVILCLSRTRTYLRLRELN
nr:unnamed protein product [Callosobruchus analis]